jgi:hypothetical protein
MELLEWETEKVEMQEVGMELERGARELEMEMEMEMAVAAIELERVSFCQMEIELGWGCGAWTSKISISFWFCASDLMKAVQGNRQVFMKKYIYIYEEEYK